MSTKKTIKKISDEKVHISTGKTWDEWFKILDAAGANKMNHKEIITYMKEKYQFSPWWIQMVTVNYEQQRGLRELYQKTKGNYEISVSKTINVSLTKLWVYFDDEKKRKDWLNTPVIIHKASPHKSMRITWSDGQKCISVNFYDKKNNKSQVVIQHMKLPDAKASEEKKTYWAERLERLKDLCER